MTEDLESARRELHQVLSELAKLERDNADPELVREYRALRRHLADKVSDTERSNDL
jgi:hypothetical protein